MRAQAENELGVTQMSDSVFVTGADGFIGSHLCEHLVAAGYRIKALAQYNSFNSIGWLKLCPPDIAAEIEVVSGDIRDSSFVEGAVRGCDCVLNLAALIGIPYSYYAPHSYVETNVNGVLNVLLAARAHGARVIQTSTSEVYGTAQYVPIDEKHPLNAQSPYAATKIAADQLALSFHASFDMPVTVVRPFNTYGPRQSVRAVIPTIITQIAAGKKQIKLGALTPTRDFSFVSDTALGMMAAINAPAAYGKVVNLGSNFEISIADTVDVIIDIMDADIEVLCDEDRIRPEASEVNRLYSDNTLAAEVLGWRPQFGGRNGFVRGMRETVKWFSDQHNLVGYDADAYVI